MTTADYLDATAAPLVLALDTSAKLTGIALTRGEAPLLRFEAQLEDTRSSRLWSILDFLLAECGLKIGDIRLFAVCRGPGGFTGLRVGLTAVKGFAAALAKPIVGVTSLEAYAAAVAPFAASFGDRAGQGVAETTAAPLICVVNNAYKGEVYWQRFSLDLAGLPVAETAPAVSVLEDALARLLLNRPENNFKDRFAELPEERSLLITGDAALANQAQIHERLVASGLSAHQWQVIGGQQFLACYIARIAYFRYKADSTIAAQAVTACYVRGADIKIKQQG